MYKFNRDEFAKFMDAEYGIKVDPSLVGEESINLYRDELDDHFVSKALTELLPEEVLIHTCSYKNEKEWLVGVICDKKNTAPLILVVIVDDKLKAAIQIGHLSQKIGQALPRDELPFARK